MGNFRDNRRGGERSFGRRDFGGRGGGDRQMYRAICSNCGKDCEVPFKPNGSKPVLCSDCFRNAGGGDARRSEGRDRGRPSFGRKSDNGGRSERPQFNEQFESLNAKLDKILKLLGQEAPQKQPKASKLVVEEVSAAPMPAEVEPEMPEIPQKEKMVEELQLQPEEPTEPTLIPEKKTKTRKTTPDITPVE